MIRHYVVRTILRSGKADSPAGVSGDDALEWENVGGQMMLKADLENLKNRVKTGEITDWESVHQEYRRIGESAGEKRLAHARLVLNEIRGGGAAVRESSGSAALSREEITESLETAGFILKGIIDSRRKDYENHFRNITYDNPAERDAVLGPLEENEFIRDAEKDYREYSLLVEQTLAGMSGR
jgi:hypothetical protein